MCVPPSKNFCQGNDKRQGSGVHCEETVCLPATYILDEAFHKVRFKEKCLVKDIKRRCGIRVCHVDIAPFFCLSDRVSQLIDLLKISLLGSGHHPSIELSFEIDSSGNPHSCIPNTYTIVSQMKCNLVNSVLPAPPGPPQKNKIRVKRGFFTARCWGVLICGHESTCVFAENGLCRPANRVRWLSFMTISTSLIVKHT